jgi:tRNA A58 N-methylase Trm61
MLKLANLKPGETLFDLGSGDGAILIVGAEEFGAYCVGIEKDAKLVEKARKNIEKRGLKDKIEIICDDIFSPEYWAYETQEKPYTVSNADVVALYLNFDVDEILKPKLEKELKPGARVVSYEFYIRGWEEIANPPLSRIFVYQKGKSF